MALPQKTQFEIQRLLVVFDSSVYQPVWNLDLSITELEARCQCVSSQPTSKGVKECSCIQKIPWLCQLSYKERSIQRDIDWTWCRLFSLLRKFLPKSFLHSTYEQRLLRGLFICSGLQGTSSNTCKEDSEITTSLSLETFEWPIEYRKIIRYWAEAVHSRKSGLYRPLFTRLHLPFRDEKNPSKCFLWLHRLFGSPVMGSRSLESIRYFKKAFIDIAEMLIRT